MESEPKPILLSHATQALLKEIGRSQELFAPYGLEPDQAAALLASITEPMLEGAALPMVTIQQLRWYVRELARLFRTRYGYALAFQLELVLRKWAAYGLEPATIQTVLHEVADQLRLMGRSSEVAPAPAAEPEGAAEEPRLRDEATPETRAGPVPPQVDAGGR